MQPESIFEPVVALALLTFAVLAYTGYKRFSAGFAGRVRAHDFRYGESGNVPPDVAVANRSFMNLLEAPVLFYVVCIAAYVTHLAGPGLVALAWLYVALRFVHTFVHLSYNKILHRFLTYSASNVVLLGMWLRFAAGLAQMPG